MPQSQRGGIPGVRPNWIVLVYLAAFGAVLAATVFLATTTAILALGSWLTKRPVVSPEGWLVVPTVLALGILPWPALVALARALILPRKLDVFDVESRPVGTAAVVLTALNDEQAIEQAVRDFAGAPGVGTIIVADNGSDDRTRDIAAAEGARVVLEERRGYGYACIRALTEGLRSGHPVVILCESDRTFRAADVEKFMAYLKHTDLVIGSRTHGALLSSDSQLNSFFALGNVLIAKLLQFRYWDWKIGGRVRLTDVGCTYRAIRAEALQRILPALEVGGSHFGPHMTMVAIEHGLRVVEAPVTFWKRVGLSKGGNASWRKGFALGLAMIWHILTYQVRRGIGAEVRRPREHMRILFLATRDWLNPEAAGGDIQSWEYARYLASVGHAVTFLAAKYPGAAREEVVDGIRVVRLGGILSLWLHTFAYYVRYCRGKYDVVVAEGFGGSRIPRFAPLYVKEPIITEWRQIYRQVFANQYPRVFARPLNALEGFTARIHRKTFVVAFTQEGQEAFRNLGFNGENTFLVPVSIREEWLNQDGLKPGSEPKVIWLGKFNRYKCPHHVVEAMAQVAREIPGARLILAGRHTDRNYEAELKRLAQRLGLEERVEFLFNITEAEKKTLLKGCRVLVLPSSVEGFGIVVLEANACGVPVVASSGVPEGAVQHRHNGLRYPFGDIAALAQSILRILKEEELYASLSANGRVFARQFSWHSVGRQFEEVVRRAVGNGQQHR